MLMPARVAASYRVKFGRLNSSAARLYPLHTGPRRLSEKWLHSKIGPTSSLRSFASWSHSVSSCVGIGASDDVSWVRTTTSSLRFITPRSSAYPASALNAAGGIKFRRQWANVHCYRCVVEGLLALIIMCDRLLSPITPASNSRTTSP